jgi:1-acyl-sn-glycerol-3-phosphate acyltransferase
MKIREKIFKPVLRIFYKSKYKFIVNYNDFDHKRTDPYFLIGNHASLHDGLYTSTFLKKYPYPVINAFMFVNKKMKFVLQKMIYSIPKRKGQSDIGTIREMMRIVKEGRGIMLFPEGNSSFFGNESEIPYSTVKLFKKFKLDVVVCLTNGAYLSAPRWGDKTTHNGLMELNFHTLFKGEELENYSLDEIYSKLVEALKFNDFDWNREYKYLYKPKRRALGLENYIYVCPKCLKHQTLHTKNNDIYCKDCGHIAYFDDFSLIAGLDFDNLIEWDKLQKQQLPKIVKEVVYTEGSMFLVDTNSYESTSLGHADLELIGRQIFVQNKMKEYVFDLDKLSGLALTKKNEVSFDYGKQTYLFKLKDPMLYYDAINYLKGEKANG